MTEAGLAVVHFLDGKLQKGTTQDFFPNRPLFHLMPAGGGAAVEVHCKLLKAVFFVKKIEGNPGRTSVQGFLAAPAATAHGKKIAVRFKDGELLCGYTLSHQPDRDGFFLFPADPESNNIRVYVLSAAAAEIKAGPAAEEMARKALSGKKKP
jgi:hypothetical protein